MMMKKWWLGSKHSNKQALKFNQLKLEFGLFGANVGTSNDKLAIEIIEIKKCNENFSSSCSMVPFHRTLKPPCTHTTPWRRFVTAVKDPSLVWDNRDLCVFDLVLKDSCHVAFNVLYGHSDVEESKGKMKVVGKVSMILGMEEMKTESNIQRKLPIRLKVNGLIIEATLSVSLRLLKHRSCDDVEPTITFENTVKSDKKDSIVGKVNYLTCLTKKNNEKFDEGDENPYESDGSPVFESDDSSNESTTSNSGSSSSNSPKEPRVTFLSSDIKTSLDTLHRNRSFKGWKNFKTNTTKQQTFTTSQIPFTKSDEFSPRSNLQGDASKWETKYILSRDGKAKLKTNVFYASFDQRSEKASGESACTVLVALIAHWLHSNQGIPTRPQFDNLITQGSSEWRKLCKNDYYSKLFPDKHFDLETVIDANLRPLIVLPQKSYTGFFSPEKFHCLEGVMSFDEIWNEISNNNVVDFEPRIYIVSWNDHFFVLKVEVDAYYIIDSLGERLFEGCQRAFALKFDDSCVMYGKKDLVDEEVNSTLKENGGVKSNLKGEESLEIVCRGKECCKEFIKQFLAAISVRELEKEEKKWCVSNPYLHRQLQIDFHFSTPLSSSTSSMLYFLTNEHQKA
ncbi:hypothetical protein QL285_065522 [Trifolium repens]|nr:hypothetical protein QL285_065522 [Trifolium repens]